MGGVSPLPDGISALPQIRIGNVHDAEALTGVTVVLVEDGAEAGVDVRGAAPGTRETDLLQPVNLVQQVHAVVLSGGSAYGLDSAQGVVRYLEERGKGFPVSGLGRVVPIVPAAVLFDLAVGAFQVRPTADWGYQAACAATGALVEQGNVGAGMGATVGKVPPGRPMKGGLGNAALDLGDGLLVAALVAVNAAGHVVDPRSGRFYAETALAEYGVELPRLPPITLAPSALPRMAAFGANTTLAVVATTASLSKTQLTKVAQMAHDGLARAVKPAHTMNDGDTIFALSVGGETRVPGDVSAVGTAAADALSWAIVNAILAARGVSEAASFADYLQPPKLATGG